MIDEKKMLKELKMYETIDRAAKACEYCGKVYIPRGTNSKYCCQKCSKDMRRLRDRNKAKKRKKKDADEKANLLLLYAGKAKAAGLSYGEYVARKEYGKR